MNMIRTWTGQQDELRAEKIDKAAILELKINEAKKMELDLTDDLGQIITKLTQINEQELQEDLSQLNAKKKGYLQLHEPEQAKRLEQLAHEEMLTKQLITEIGEAEEAGEAALTKLGQAAESLHSQMVTQHGIRSLVGDSLLAFKGMMHLISPKTIFIMLKLHYSASITNYWMYKTCQRNR